MTQAADRRRFLSATLGGLAVAPLAASGCWAQGGAPLPTLPPSSADISVRDFGAVGDAQLRPLSSVFPTLAAAQARLPAATLADSLDGAAIQSAIDAAERLGEQLQVGARVHLPRGRYPLSHSLRLPGNVMLTGDGAGVTIIDNQNVPLAEPLVVNKNPSVASIALRGMSLHGGTHGLRLTVDGYVDHLAVEDVAFLLQRDKNVECNKLLQQAVFTRCTFGMSPYGVYAAGWTTNAASFHHCNFENHSEASLTLRGAECVNVYGGRFEGGGREGPPTIDVEAAAGLNLFGVYFENVHRLLLLERRSRDGVTFAGCHFTGAKKGDAFVPFAFDSDGVVSFGPNDWNLPTPAPARAVILGPNRLLRTTGRLIEVRAAGRHRITSERMTLAPGQRRRLLTVTRRAAEPGGVGSASAMGLVELTIATNPPRLHRVTCAASARAGDPIGIDLGTDPSLAGTGLGLYVVRGGNGDSAAIEASANGPAIAFRASVDWTDLHQSDEVWLDVDVG